MNMFKWLRNLVENIIGTTEVPTTYDLQVQAENAKREQFQRDAACNERSGKPVPDDLFRAAAQYAKLEVDANAKNQLVITLQTGSPEAARIIGKALGERLPGVDFEAGSKDLNGTPFTHTLGGTENTVTLQRSVIVQTLKATVTPSLFQEVKGLLANAGLGISKISEKAGILDRAAQVANAPQARPEKTIGEFDIGTEEPKPAKKPAIVPPIPQPALAAAPEKNPIKTNPIKLESSPTGVRVTLPDDLDPEKRKRFMDKVVEAIGAKVAEVNGKPKLRQDRKAPLHLVKVEGKPLGEAFIIRGATMEDFADIIIAGETRTTAGSKAFVGALSNLYQSKLPLAEVLPSTPPQPKTPSDNKLASATLPEVNLAAIGRDDSVPSVSQTSVLKGANSAKTLLAEVIRLGSLEGEGREKATLRLVTEKVVLAPVPKGTQGLSVAEIADLGLRTGSEILEAAASKSKKAIAEQDDPFSGVQPGPVGDPESIILGDRPNPRLLLKLSSPSLHEQLGDTKQRDAVLNGLEKLGFKGSYYDKDEGLVIRGKTEIEDAKPRAKVGKEEIKAAFPGLYDEIKKLDSLSNSKGAAVGQASGGRG